MNAKDVKRIRAKLGLSQSKFADLLGLSVRTVQDWEIDRNKPGAPAAALLKLADSGVLTIKTISMRDIERSAKGMRDGAAKAQLSRDAAHRKVAALIRKTGKPKAK
jgi:transcriptional regulator with XRE-family HTH domain